MSDTYGANGQPAVEAQEKVVETTDTVLVNENVPENGAVKHGWIDPEGWVPKEESPEPNVKKPKVKEKTKTKSGAAKKPTKRGKPAELDEFGFRKGTIRSKAAQLYASAKGATLDEVKKKLGSVQYNMLTALKERGFKVTTKEIDGKNNRPATRYFLKSKKR